MDGIFQNVINVAAQEVGYLEKASNAQLDDKTANAGSNNYTKYARDLDALSWFNGKKQGYAWCAVFVTWCFYQAYGMIAKEMLFQPDKDNCAAGCGSARSYYNKQGHLFNEPAVGDQIFFWSSDMSKISHTGLVVGVDGSRVYTIEGNTSGGSSVIANGGAVCKKDYALDYKRIAGYGRPEWAQDDTGDADKEEQKMSYTARVQAANGGKVNLRSIPSVKGKVLYMVPSGLYVTVQQDMEDGVWAKCTYDAPDGKTYAGYMMREYLTMEIYDGETVNVSRAELQAIYHAIGKLLGKE